jgi:hypothetical protein
MSQQMLASKVQILGWDIDRSGIAKIELGIRQVTDIEVLILSQALDVSPCSLFIVRNDFKQKET